MSENTSLASSINLSEDLMRIEPPAALVDALLAEIRAQGERITSLESNQENLFGIIARARKVIEDRDEPAPIQKDRADILRALLLANQGKMLRQDARKMMRMDENRFSELLSTTRSWIEVKPSKLEPRKKLIVLK